MTDVLVLKITDRLHVELGGMILATTIEVTQALQEILRDRPDVMVSIEADASAHYEAMGRAIYGSTRAGFSGERLRVTVDGKALMPLPATAT